MRMIQVGSILVGESLRMTQVLGLESEPYSGNWCLNKATPENRPLTRRDPTSADAFSCIYDSRGFNERKASRILNCD